jgi:hypothetical protein
MARVKDRVLAMLQRHKEIQRRGGLKKRARGHGSRSDAAGSMSPHHLPNRPTT